jgi:AcrR family transcriptional regulator
MGGRDIERTLELLWGTRQEPTRGPKPSLTPEEIVAAAVEIADAGGLEAVTMRRVAERFDVTTMALYRYIPSKDDLLELMFDAVAYPPPDPAEMPDDWRDALRWWARWQREALRRHPWLLSMPLALPPMGPNNIQWMEWVLQAILRSGLPAQQSVAVLLLVANFTLAQSRQQRSMQQAEQLTGVAFEDVGRVYAQLLERVVADGEHPALASAIAAGAFGNTDATASGPEEDFEYGLEFILDGIQALAERHTAPQSSDPQ